MKKHSKRLLTAAALVMTTTATIHIINKVIAASACLKEMLDTDVRNYYHWRFGDIYYTKKGKGSPILLIHDMLPGGSGYEWTRIEDELALEHTVYNLDLPGCGRSATWTMLFRRSWARRSRSLPRGKCRPPAYRRCSRNGGNPFPRCGLRRRMSRAGA